MYGQHKGKTEGKLADGFAVLLKQLWSNTSTSCTVNPRTFKSLVGDLSCRFDDNAQHDAAEFIENLIDGLKEDCNWVKGKKPYIERKEADGRPDVEVALEASNGFLLRSDSVVDDLFVGFLQSTTKCPECKKRSVVFEPTLSVKLPILRPTESQHVTLVVTVVPLAATGRPITRKSVLLAKVGCVRDLVEAVAAESEIAAPEWCLLAHLLDGEICKFFDDIDQLANVSSDDVLVLYELEDASNSSQSFRKVMDEHIWALAVVHCRLPPIRSSLPIVEPVGLPLIFFVPKESEDALFTTVRSELIQRFGPKAVSGWQLMKVRCGEMASTEQPLKDVGGVGEDECREARLRLCRQRENLIVEWELDCLVPPQLFEARQIAEDGPGSSLRPEDVVTLEKCFEWFTQGEQLSEHDAVYCSSCKQHRRVFKKIEFWSFPPVLVVQLKRFEHSGLRRRRLGNPVVFPLEGLDLNHLWSSRAASFPSGQCLRAEQLVEVHGLQSEAGCKLNGAQGVAKYLDTVTGRFCVCLCKADGPEDWKKFKPENLRPVCADGSLGAVVPMPLYDLVGVCIHIGSMSSGHYAAFARSSEDSKWRLFNDDEVIIVAPKEVERARSSAYVLFYIRRDCRPGAWGQA